MRGREGFTEVGTCRPTEAFANQVNPPRWQTAHQEIGRARFGLKLTLSWDETNNWHYEVVMSLVLMGAAADFDPGGSIGACKFYPQLAMRYSAPKKGKPAKKIKELRGAIQIVAANVIPPNAVLPDELLHMRSGRQSITLATDSNSSDWDSTYEFENADVHDAGAEIREFFTTLIPFVDTRKAPEAKLMSGKWKNVRLLASVVENALTDPDTTVGATARYWSNRWHRVPGLPHWSWLFDYVLPELSGTKKLACAYRKGDRYSNEL